MVFSEVWEMEAWFAENSWEGGEEVGFLLFFFVT